MKQVETVQFSPFTELLTEGFDKDQIWEEIASQNEPFLDYAKSTLKALSKRPVKDEKFSDEESESGESMDLDPQEDQVMEEASEEEEELLEENDDELEQEDELEAEEEDLEAEEDELEDDEEEEVAVKDT